MIVNRYTVKRILDGEDVGDEQDVAGRAAALASLRAEQQQQLEQPKASHAPGLLDEQARAGRSSLLGR